MYEFLKTQLLSNQFFSGAFLTGGLAAVLYFLRDRFIRLYYLFLDKYTVDISIDSTDEVFYYFQQWLIANDFSKLFRKYRVVSTDNENVVISVREGGDISLSPGNGTYWLKYNNKYILVSYSSNIKQESGTNPIFRIMYTISLKYLGRNKTTLHKILDDISQHIARVNKDCIDVYVPNCWRSDWETQGKLPKRNEKSIILRDSYLDIVLKDLDLFKSRKDWYMTHGIPYHRGYLFYGPPGTGKTSLKIYLQRN